jgi:hypothetical protein
MAGGPEATGISIGGILSRAFGVMGDNPVVVFGLSFLFGAVPAVAYRYFFTTMVLGGVTTGVVRPATIFGLSITSSLVLMFFGILAQAAIIRATAAYANGERASLGECLAVALSKLLPLAGLTILLLLGVMAGFILLFVPGIMLFIMWSVAAPALVSEPIGLLEAFGRSRFLTKGARWRIFGMFVLLAVVFWIVSAILGVVAISAGIAMVPTQPFGAMPVWYLIISAITSTLTTAFASTVATALYLSLRSWKDGPDSSALADIFS